MTTKDEFFNVKDAGEDPNYIAEQYFVQRDKSKVDDAAKTQLHDISIDDLNGTSKKLKNDPYNVDYSPSPAKTTTPMETPNPKSRYNDPY